MGDQGLGDAPSFDQLGASRHTDFAARPVVLEATDVDKTFRVPHEAVHTLKQRIIKPGRRTYENFEALHDVSFDVRQGEFFGIVGRNGSGKSTLLKCIAGIYPTTAGEIKAAGRISTFIELGVGFNPELNARENIVINATLMGMPAGEAHKRFDEIIAFAELEDFTDLKLKNYSSGMQVRLAFSVAIHAEADILLIDEVLAVGDAAFQRKCFDVFEALREGGKTVVLVTHDMSMIERFCSRALMLEHGKVVSRGEPADVAHDYMQINIDKTTDLAQTRERWGDGAAEIVEAWIEDEAGEATDSLSQHVPVSIKTRVRFKEPMRSPIIGITLHDEQKQRTFVTNTMWDGVELGDCAAGDELVCTFEFENHLADGRYFISPAVAHSDAITVADWREHYVTVLVQGRRQTGGKVDLPHRTKIERVEAGATTGTTGS